MGFIGVLTKELKSKIAHARLNRGEISLCRTGCRFSRGSRNITNEDAAVEVFKVGSIGGKVVVFVW